MNMTGPFLEFTVDEQGRSQHGQILSREARVAINLAHVQEIQAVDDGSRARLILTVHSENGLRVIAVKEAYQMVLQMVRASETTQ
jgi:hypothetical protein